MSDEEETNVETEVPDVQVCNQLCEEFVSITNSNNALAHFFLQEAKWKLETALNRYFASQTKSNRREAGINVDEGDDSDGFEIMDPPPDDAVVFEGEDSASSAIATASTGTTASASIGSDKSKDDDSNGKVFKLMSWNIDGLDKNGVTIRTKAVCTIVLRDKPTVVFLQEVIPESLEILSDYLCDEYWVMKGIRPGASSSMGGMPPYFTAMLLKRDSVKLDREPDLIEYSGSHMGRSLLKIELEIFDKPCVLMTSHLESTKVCAQERMKQLRTCFDIMEKIPDNVSAFFGGDLNLRDTELDQIGGMPPGVEDLWIRCGSQKHCQYTWDCMKNDNLNMEHGKFKPRSRFDRIYVKHSTADDGASWRPKEFSFVGMQRIQKYNRFPSDHFGIVCSLEKI